MEDYIVCTLQPFIFKQKIEVYINQKLIENIHCKMKELEDTIYGLCKKYNISKVALHGNTIFNMKLENSLRTKYEKEIPMDIIYC